MLACVGPVLKSRASSPSHVRGLNRPVEAVVGTQLSGPKQQTHTIARQPFSHKSFAPLLRGHHPEGRLGLAVFGIASPSDGVGKLANYYCSTDGTRPGSRKKQIISSARPRSRDFLSRSCFSKTCSQYACRTGCSRSDLALPPMRTFPSNINNDLDI
jgi:hypothetical protein